jgi:nucleotide-binding universal stress UspA family protein
MKAFKHILVALDFSKCADHAFGYAAQMVAESGGRVTVVHVTAVHPPFTMDSRALLWALDDLAEKREKRHLTEHVNELLGRQKVRFEVETPWGDPAQTIVDRSRELGCDLVVIGTHGRSGWNRLVIGSVAEKVVRHAPCPVLTVRLPETRPVPTRRAAARPRAGGKRAAKRA